MKRGRLLAIPTLMVLLLSAMGQVFASYPPDVTEAEYALLSPGCRHVQSKPGYREMLARYGFAWSHMHHYCWAEIDYFRLNRPRVGQRPGYADVSRAIGNVDYVLRNSTPEFAFWKDAQILKIRIFDRYVNENEAIKLAEQLVEVMPELADGYTILAGLLLKAGRRDEAMKILAAGQSKVSDKERFELQKSILPLR